MTEPQPIIGMDIDGTLGDYMVVYNEIGNRLGKFMRTGGAGRRAVYFDDTISDRDRAHIFDSMTTEDYMRIPPLVSVSDLKAFKILSRRVRVVYISHRPEALRNVTNAWLERFRFPSGQVITPYPFTKGEALMSLIEQAGGYQDLNPVGVLDDAPHDLESYHASTLAPCYVRDWPYNRDTPPYVERVSSLEEFCDLVEQYMDGSTR